MSDLLDFQLCLRFVYICGQLHNPWTHVIIADMLDAWWGLADELMLKHAQPAAPGVGLSELSELVVGGC